MLYGIAAATSALFLASLLSALLRPLARRLGVVERRRRRGLPVVGGPAVTGAVLLVAGAGEWAGVARLGGEVGRLLAGAVAVALLGLVADVRPLRARVLGAGTAVSAACVMPYAQTGVLGGVLGVGWIVLVSLGFRGLDRADGLAGTVGVVTAFGVGVCAALEVMDGLAVLLSVLAAALTGFLMHNWHPARVGLGSGGALFTGFVLAAAAVLTRAGHGLGSGTAVLFALTAVVAAGVLLARRLRRLGLTPQGVTVVLGASAFCGVLVGVLVSLGWLTGSGGLWVAAGALVVVLLLLRATPSAQVGGQLRVRNG